VPGCRATARHPRHPGHPLVAPRPRLVAADPGRARPRLSRVAIPRQAPLDHTPPSPPHHRQLALGRGPATAGPAQAYRKPRQQTDRGRALRITASYRHGPPGARCLRRTHRRRLVSMAPEQRPPGIRLVPTRTRTARSPLRPPRQPQACPGTAQTHRCRLRLGRSRRTKKTEKAACL
ncbi:MAG: FIG00657500: hypothetical protein, partial [Olavius algarvensis Gamma 1 endosymbiont]